MQIQGKEGKGTKEKEHSYQEQPHFALEGKAALHGQGVQWGRSALGDKGSSEKSQRGWWLKRFCTHCRPALAFFSSMLKDRGEKGSGVRTGALSLTSYSFASPTLWVPQWPLTTGKVNQCHSRARHPAAEEGSGICCSSKEKLEAVLAEVGKPQVTAAYKTNAETPYCLC